MAGVGDICGDYDISHRTTQGARYWLERAHRRGAIAGGRHRASERYSPCLAHRLECYRHLYRHYHYQPAAG